MSIKVLSERYFDFPDFVRVVALGELPPDAPHDVADIELQAVEIPESLQRAAPKRILEYRIGRVAALRALHALGKTDAASPEQAPDGAPIWPAGVSGSITHTARFTAAAVARTTDVESIGIDAESFAGTERLEAALAVALAPEERAELDRLIGKRPDGAKIRLGVISAKESVIKCCKLPRGSIDFRDIRLGKLESRGLNRFVASFLFAAAGEDELAVSISFDDQRVYSCCIKRKKSSDSSNF